MGLVFTVAHDCVIDDPTPLEIDLKRFLAIHRKSAHFISPESSFFQDTFRHYDRHYLSGGCAIPLPELKIHKGVMGDDPDFLQVLDGRKRLAWLARHEEKTLPVLVPKSDKATIRSLIGIREKQYDVSGLISQGLIELSKYIGRGQLKR